MAFRSLCLYSAILLNVIAFVASSSSARSTDLVKLTDLRDELDRPVYSWMIGEDEQERLTDLLEYDFRAVGVAGTYVTAPPHKCPRCGKETEFIDWVYTALARGVHSREFIVESLKEGRTPESVHHDVYCSRCGHLTHFRDHSGHEGGSMHIAQAAPYDRVTKTFGTSTLKRDAEVTTEGPLEKKAEKAGWCQRCVLGNWIIKREESTEGSAVSQRLERKSEDAGWCQRCVLGNWIIKRDQETTRGAGTAGVETDEKLEKKAENAGWCQRCVLGNWIIKRDSESIEEPPVSQSLEKKGEDAGWCQRCVLGNWIIKRNPVTDAEQ